MKNFKNIIISNLDIIFFIILLVIKLLTFGKQISPVYFSKLALLPPIIASLFILVGISCIFTKKTRSKLLYIFNLIMSICIIADINYFRYFKDVISIPVIKTGFQLNAVGSSVENIFKMQDLLYIVDLIFIIPIANYFKNRKGIENPLKIRFAIFGVLFVLGGLVNAKCLTLLAKEQPRLLDTMYNRVYVARALGGINYHCLDVVNAIRTDLSKKTPLSNEKEVAIKKFLQNNSTKEKNNLKGIAKGKNLIVFQIEALQEFVINKTIEGQEITPNLNKLIKRSTYFDNYFYQIGAGNTADAEFTSNNSLYPASSGVAYYKYCSNTFNSLPQALKAKGYDTAAFHGFRESFWNRNVMYKKLEFNNFFGESSFNVKEKIGLGLSDKCFFEQSVDKLKTLKKPYYAFMVTLTSHFPFNATDKYGEFNVGEFEGTVLGDYLKSIHYTDKYLGNFLDTLEENGVFDDTIIALYGDHLAIPKKYENLLAKFLGHENPTFSELEWMQLQKVPMLIHFPGDKYKGVNHTYSGEMDLYPTLANLFNLDSSNLMGKDILNAKDGKVIFRYGSFTDGKIFYISTTGNYYNIETGEILKETNELKDKKEQALNELQYSDEILNHNLLKKFKENKNTNNK